MVQKERLKELNLAIKYFIETNYPIHKTLLLFEGDADISDQRQRLFNELQSDESILIHDLDFEIKGVRSEKAKSNVDISSKFKNKSTVGIDRPKFNIGKNYLSEY